MHSGLVFNIQKYSVQDGPGIRTTVFLKGCPLHCAWCHNPESISAARELVVIETRCLVCGECRKACRFGSIIPGDSVLPTQNDPCAWCGECVDACPTEARQMVGQSLTERQVLDIILQDRIFYEESGGGATFSGGEPLAQAPFLKSLLLGCRAQGIHTAVDTSGMGRLQALLEIAPLTDLFLYDLKLLDEVRHRQHTGVSNRLILENLQALGSRHRNIWVRVPIIPGINDQTSDLQAIADFAAGVGGVRQVNLLPFHQHGAHKAHRLGQSPLLSELAPPSPALLQSAMEIFQRAGLVTKIGG